jgi:deazaflavin-dependent oxidoreductase (nitroreductase family)
MSVTTTMRVSPSGHSGQGPTGYRPQREKSGIDRAMQAVAKSRLGGWLFINVFPAIDRWMIPLSRGRLKVAMGQPILLLHTRGARSGEPRTTPLLYTPHDDTFLIVASKAGAEHNPAWYHNLLAHRDDVAVEIGATRIAVSPRVAEGAEREALWELVNDNYNGYDTYQMRAGRRLIPIVVLDRRNPRWSDRGDSAGD